MFKKCTAYLLLATLISSHLSWAGDGMCIEGGLDREGKPFSRECSGGEAHNGHESEGKEGSESARDTFARGDLASGDGKARGSEHGNPQPKILTPEELAKKDEEARIEKEESRARIDKIREENAKALAERKERDARIASHLQEETFRQELKLQIEDIKNSVAAMSSNAKEMLALPNVTAQLEQNTERYIISQLEFSEQLVESSQKGLDANMKPSTAKIMTDFAVDTVTSINSFLSGVASGAIQPFYDSAIGLQTAAEAIYQNPKIVANLSKNVMHALTSSESLKSVKEYLSTFSQSLIEGSAYDKGHALGEVSTFVLLGLSGVERNVLGRVAFEKISEKVVTADVMEELTTSLISKAQGPKLLSEEIAELETVTGTTFEAQSVTRHGPLNPGRLHEIPQEGSLGTVADTFRNTSYTTRTTTDPTLLYRVQNYPPNQEFPLAPYWTTQRPYGPVQSIIDSAIDQRWDNRGMEWIEIEVPAGRVIHEGLAAEQRGLVGGGNQVYIEGEIPHSWIQNNGRFGQ